MNSFSIYLEKKDPELFNEINFQYWIDKAKDQAKNLFGIESVKKISRIGWQEIAKKLAQGAVLTSGLINSVAQAEDKPYQQGYQTPSMSQKAEIKEIEIIGKPIIDEVDIQGNAYNKVSFKLVIPKHLLSPEKGAIRYAKLLLLKKFQSDELLGYNPYSSVRVSINGQGIPAKNIKDLINKTFNSNDSSLDNFKLKQENEISFFIPKKQKK